MTSTKALAYFRNYCKTRIVADAGPEGIGAVLLQFQGEEWRAVSYASRNLWSGVMHRRKRKRLLLRWLESGSIYMCVVVNLSWRQITNHSNVSSVRRRNHPQE